MEPHYIVRVELNVDLFRADPGGDETVDVGRFGELALGWLEGGSRLIDAELVDDLAATKPSSDFPADPYAPWGPPGGAVGAFTVSRPLPSGRLGHSRRGASAPGWRWLAEQVGRPPVEAAVLLRRLDDQGYPQSFINMGVSSHFAAPGWVRLYREVASTAMTPEVQSSCLMLVRTFADRIDPSYGQVGPVHEGDRTALEACLPSAYGRNQPPRSIVESRQWLRGYTWVTVLAREHVERLGGISVIAGSGVFHDVHGLPGGGAILQATQDFYDYDQAKAEQVFRVLAPVLRPGLPAPPRPKHGAPYLIVYEDASTVVR